MVNNQLIESYIKNLKCSSNNSSRILANPNST